MIINFLIIIQELDENSVCAKFAQTADDGKTYNYKFYSLAAIIAVGYRINSEQATVQNKMHYAVHGNTAAEVIVARADHNKEHMGLKSWKNAPDGKIVKTDVSIAKNYLEKEELAELNEIVTMYLDYATRQARRHIPMTMEDWKTKLDAFLRFNDADVLQDKGKVTASIAKEFAESEFEKYRVIQDSLYESDFDKLMNDMEKNDAIR